MGVGSFSKWHKLSCPQYTLFPIKSNVNRGIFRLAQEVSFEDGVFIEPLACVVRGQRLASLHLGQSILVLGSGITGLLHIALARASGAGRIVATDVNEFRLNAALRFGADSVIDAKENVPARLRNLNDGRLADLVIICTGAFSAFIQALQSVAPGGTVLFFAPTEPGITIPVPVNDFWRNGITLLPSYGASPFDIVVATELIRARRVPVREMVSHRLSLEETGRGFQLVANAEQS
ncbi:MAG: zinc-binding dehydrogenase [Chloroflexi bacterium]|nr:zinc-binding dehydrogenase [Chloroflexota bacterium]